MNSDNTMISIGADGIDAAKVVGQILDDVSRKRQEGVYDEARVARAIIVGQTVESFSSSLGVSRETVRAQLKSVFAKTGVQRQAELVALLVGKTLPLA